MVLTGLGLGLGVNVPHIAIQAVMETDNDVFIANGIASFFGQLGGSLGVPIGNAILIKALKTNVLEKAPGISLDAAVDAGALALSSLTTSESMLAGLRQAWALSIGSVNVFLVAIICISVPTACGMHWLNIKTISREREQQKKVAARNGLIAASAEDKSRSV